MELPLIDSSATDEFGASLARTLPRPPTNCAVVFLHGELGAGKTACVRSLLRALGVDRLIRSPTYTLVEIYTPAGMPCIHLDLFRLQGPVEVDELGLRDYLDGAGLLLVEWPENGAAALPAPDLDLTFTYQGNGRHVRAVAQTDRGHTWLENLASDTRLASYVSHLT